MMRTVASCACGAPVVFNGGSRRQRLIAGLDVTCDSSVSVTLAVQLSSVDNGVKLDTSFLRSLFSALGYFVNFTVRNVRDTR